MKKYLISLFALVACIPSMAQDKNSRLLGADISMLPKYEERGSVFRDAQGNEVKPLEFFKQSGWNAARVRLFVNPDKAPEQGKGEGVCQDIPYVAKFGKQIKDAGMQFMLDFHYSDTWADPGKQFIPADWTDHSVDALCSEIYKHTVEALKAMKKAGAEPELIQVGNEITNGMLWPVGKINHNDEDDWSILCRMVSSGTKACREQCPKARIIIHTEKAGDWEITKRFYEELRKHDNDYDIIGLSYYPMWHRNVGVLSATLDSLQTFFPEKEVMIVETASYYSHDNDKWSKPDSYSEFYPISIDGQTMFTKELVAELRRHPNVTGLFWWFAEENASGGDVTKGWINRGLFDNHTGRALPAFYEFNKYLKQ